jgi:hypothetical protein
MWIALIVGSALVGYGLIASYHMGIFRAVGLPMLWIDGLAGMTLAFSPWMLGASTEVFLPHVVVGVVEIAAAMAACLVPSYTGTSTA